MKKILCLFTGICLLCLIMTGCAESKKAEDKDVSEESELSGISEPEEQLCGGWTVKNTVPTKEETDIFYNAIKDSEDLKNCKLDLLYGTQVVAGINYAFICTDESKTPPEKLKVTVYKDLKGNVTVTDTEKTD